MLTRCPECDTTFRVTSEQLKARGGDVRCGACQKVFNALDTLVEEPVTVVVEPIAAPAVAVATPAVAVSTAPSDAESPVPQAPSAPPTASDSAPALPPTPIAIAVARATEAATAPDVSMPAYVHTEADAPAVVSDPREAPREAPLAIAQVPPVEPARVAESPPTAADPPAAVSQSPALPSPVATPSYQPALPSSLAAARSEGTASGAAWAWGFASLLALTILALQLAVALRTEIAVLYPLTKPALTGLCSTLGCDLPFPRKAELVGIEASDLHPDAGGRGRLTMTATLKNRAPFVQEYPFLELTLTDTGDQALVRRVILPKEYLPARALLANGFPAGAELPVHLAIDAEPVAASGYRLYLFYP